MRSSSFCLRRLLLFGLAIVFWQEKVFALDPVRTVSQHIREHWGTEKGFPKGPVNAITQTKDGYLWIATDAGLVRFDGVTFTMVRAPGSSGPSIEHVVGLLADRDGSLWLQMTLPTLVHYSEGKFTVSTPEQARIETMVTAMALSKSGAPLVSSRMAGVSVLDGSRFQNLASAQELPKELVASIAQTGNGEIWMGTSEAGLVRLQPGHVSTVSEGLTGRRVNCLLPAGNDELWVGTDHGLVRWNGSGIVTTGVPAPLQHEPVLALTADRDANIWIGTATHGLVRLNGRGIAYFSEPAAASGLAVTAVFEDREGNVWAGSDSGIDRFGESAFVRYAEAEGLPIEGNGAIYADERNRIWWAPQSGGLYWLDEGSTGRVAIAGLGQDVTYSITGRQGELWLGRQRTGLTHLRRDGEQFRATTFSEKNGLAQNAVYVAEETSDKSVWAATLNAGVSLFRDGLFQTYSTNNGLAANTVTSIIQSSDGTTWFGGPGGLSSFFQGKWKSYGLGDGLPSIGVTSVFEDSKGVIWIGSLHGMGYFEAGRILAPANAPVSLQSQILGIAEDTNGNLWIAVPDQLVRAARAKLKSGALAERDTREYEFRDGVQGLSTTRRHRSMIADRRGRIWVSMNHGLSMIDPARLANDSASTVVHIESMSVADNSIDFHIPVRIRADNYAGHQKVSISYAGINLSAPDRVRYRYALDGNDHGWNEPVSTSQAVYTNLGPGAYRFHVMASNAGGLWNGKEAEIAFEVEPAFWQTWWFRTVAMVASAFLIYMLYLARVEQLNRQFDIRFEERLAERTRIARDLHDTLLQTIQGSKLLVDGALSLSKEESGDPVLRKLSVWLDQAVSEGRTAVNSLRGSTTRSNELGEAFQLAVKKHLLRGSIDASVSVEGMPQDLHPIVRDEIYRIGYEAICNACRHSDGSWIRVELSYARDFGLRVLDNGNGVPSDVAAHGKPGHFGLQGMQERATRIGGKFSLFSAAGSGTEVQLIVPGKVAFREIPKRKKIFGQVRKLVDRDRVRQD